MADLLALFWVFFRIGLVGFGGGYAMLSAIMRDVGELGVSVRQFADLTALDLAVPGPIAINAATYVGYLNEGVAGAIAATLGICAPAYAIALAVSRFIGKFRDSRVLASVLAFVKPAAMGMIGAAGLSIACAVTFGEGTTLESFAAAFAESPFSAVSMPSLAIFALSLAALLRFKLNPIAVTLMAGAAGFLLA